MKRHKRDTDIERLQEELVKKDQKRLEFIFEYNLDNIKGYEGV